ncbi:MAG: methionine adenosyltransferase [Nitrospiraceae bacterium]|nr:methionine adenosyltransferase [Nitrospiraceae bacterium]
MIVVEPFKGKSVTDQRVEIVERKGTGHPDFICDSVMEAISVALSRAYKEAFGTILHHNIDKGLLAAGRADHTFGGGRMIKPMELIIGDRATFSAMGRRIPVGEIAVDAAKRWLRKHLRFIDPEKHVKYRLVLAPGSEELTDIFARSQAIKGANDTSALIGYYPLSSTEEAVLGLERYLNSLSFKKKYPETGEDIKVMGLRTGKEVEVTVAMPLISPFIHSEDDYFEKKELLQREIEEFLRANSGFGRISVHLNALDERGRGGGGVYLSLLGTSAEDADSGQVGRGNRVNGLISVNRPMGTEAAAGKNPVSHVGKIYNILAHKTAEKIYKNVEGIREVYVLLLSRIGTPVDAPPMASVQVLLEKGCRLADVSGASAMIVERELADISSFCDRLAKGTYPVC